jgi:hypothetical protein
MLWPIKVSHKKLVRNLFIMIVLFSIGLYLYKNRFESFQLVPNSDEQVIAACIDYQLTQNRNEHPLETYSEEKVRVAVEERCRVALRGVTDINILNKVYEVALGYPDKLDDLRIQHIELLSVGVEPINDSFLENPDIAKNQSTASSICKPCCNCMTSRYEQPSLRRS